MQVHMTMNSLAEEPTGTLRSSSNLSFDHRILPPSDNLPATSIVSNILTAAATAATVRHTDTASNCDTSGYNVPRISDFPHSLFANMTGNMDSARARHVPFKHECSKCNFTTLIASQLEKHLRTHQGEKPFACQYCPFRSNQQGNLRTHMRTHTGERPFPCPYCTYRATQKIRLQTHLRSIHKDKLYDKHSDESGQI